MNQRIAYLVNVYPKVSHAFIRREILALESLGHEVRRYTLRSTPEPLVDPADIAEAVKTTVILDNKSGVILSLLLATLHPARFYSALRAALQLWSGGLSSFVKQMIYLAEAAHLARLCRRDRITHLHAHFGTNPAAVALLCRHLGGPPFSFTVHGPDEFDAPVALRLRQKIAGAKFVVAISHFCRSQLMRWADLADWDKIKIVRCGVDESFLSEPLTPPPDNNIFACVARLSEQKGLPVLIQAVALLKSRGTDIQIRLVGDGPLRRVLEEQARHLGVADRIDFLGNRSSAEIRDIIKSARAFVLPSFAEGLPVVLMEALALGRPVIATRIAAIGELVQEGQTGWLVAPGDVEGLAERLDTSLGSSQSHLSGVGGSARTQIKDLYGSVDSARQIVESIKARRRDDTP